MPKSTVHFKGLQVLCNKGWVSHDSQSGNFYLRALLSAFIFRVWERLVALGSRQGRSSAQFPELTEWEVRSSSSPEAVFSYSWRMVQWPANILGTIEAVVWALIISPSIWLSQPCFTVGVNLPLTCMQPLESICSSSLVYLFVVVGSVWGSILNQKTKLREDGLPVAQKGSILAAMYSWSPVALSNALTALKQFPVF